MTSLVLVINHFKCSGFLLHVFKPVPTLVLNKDLKAGLHKLVVMQNLFTVFVPFDRFTSTSP